MGSSAQVEGLDLGAQPIHNNVTKNKKQVWLLAAQKPILERQVLSEEESLLYSGNHQSGKTVH